jgi:16S rRNA (guanine(1405)-N(7))-methyltransferase
MLALDELVAAVLGSAKYRAMCPDTVRRLGERELAKRRSLKAAIKATKSRLHQVFGAFDQAPDFDVLLRELEQAYTSGSDEGIRGACRAALACHASTRERVRVLGRFYADIFAITGTPSRVLDLACGLHPLSLPWMGLAPDAQYLAFDIDGRAIAFLTRYFALAAVSCRAVHADILCTPPTEPADVAFLLKTLPSLEREEKGGGRRVLDALAARHVVVSFPVASLGGRQKGMRQNYERDFLEMMMGSQKEIDRIEFPTELVFVVG